MADNHTQRNFRSNEAGRTAAEGSSHGSNDPLAELARLIGQNDPFGEYGRERVKPGATTARAYTRYDSNGGSEPHSDEHYGQPPPSTQEAHQTDWGPVPGYPEPHPDASAYEQSPLQPGDAPYSEGEEDYYDEDRPPPRRRVGVLAIAAVFALAVIGTAGAYGYRAMFGSISAGPPPVIKADATPAKIVPPKKDVQSAKLINDRIGEQGEKLVSREEKPVDLAIKTPGALTQGQRVADASPAPVLGSGVVGPDPKKVHTIIIRPDQPAGNNAFPVVAAAPQEPPAAPAADPKPVAAPEPAAPPPSPAASTPQHVPSHAAPPSRSKPVNEARHPPRHETRTVSAERNAPLSLNPNAPPPVRSASTHRTRTASLAPAASARAASGGYAVQISSRRSEAEAKTAVHRLQSKYSSVLGGHSVLVRRVDLGSKGVYYRAMVGPFGSSADASKVCSDLKKAGGSCFVQRI